MERFFIPLLLLLIPAQCDPLVCNVADFGAVGDGSTLDTSAIQSAIDFCASKNNRDSSVVHIPPGNYLSGTLYLRSNTTVLVYPGATILGSPNQAHYPPQRSKWYVLLAENTEHVNITGGGSLDGQGSTFVVEFNQRKNVMVSWNTTGACLGDECRPRLIGFVSSKHVHIWNVHLRQPAYWGLHVANSSDVRIRNVSMVGDFNTPNNDGIDIDGSNNTYITNCRLDTADDGIVSKSIAGPLVNLTVTNCWVRSKSCAIKVGSETYHDLSGLLFDNITIVDSHRGLGIQLRDSGSITNVSFSNVVLSTRFYDPLWWGRAEPIYVTACPRNRTTSVGRIEDVRFINISATSENGIFLAGSGSGYLSALSLLNVHLRLARTTNYSGGLHDFRPGCQGLVPHRTAGVFMERILDLTLQNVNLSWEKIGDEDWDLPLDFTPQTIEYIRMIDFASVNVDLTRES